MEKNKKNNNAIDFSHFSVKQKEYPLQKKASYLGLKEIKESWLAMRKKDKSLVIILLVSLVLTLSILIFSLNRSVNRKNKPSDNYAPPAEYDLSPGEEYSPPFP